MLLVGALLAAAVCTVDVNGRPVYGTEPLPTYAETALTPARRASLAATLPERLATAAARLDAEVARFETAFAAEPTAFQLSRGRKRLPMAHRLVAYVALQLRKGTVSALCQAEAALEGLEAFCVYYAREAEYARMYPLAPGVNPTVLDVRAYGARGDGVTDDEPAFRKVFDAARALGGRPSVIRLPPGDYLLCAKPLAAGGRGYLRIPAVANCVIDGGDPNATRIVYGDYDGDGLDFRDWRNATLRNVQVCWRDTPFVEGEVESVDRATGSLVLRHHAGTLVPDDPRLRRVGHPNSCMQFDRAGKPIRKPVLWYDYRCQDLGGGRYRMFFDPEQGSTKTMPVEPGAVFVYPDRSNAVAALRATGSTFFTFENVWVRNSRAGAIIPGPGYMPTLVRCRIFPKDPRFCLSTNADGNFTAPGTAILACDFVNMNDDGSNAHVKGRVFETYDPKTAAWRHDSNWQWERAGDFVQVVSSLDGRFLANTRVKSVTTDPVNRGVQHTVFADPLPAAVKSYTSLGIPPYDAATRRKIFLGTKHTALFPDQFYVPFNQGTGYVCSGNRFANIRGVAIQIQAPNALVESNRIENVYRGIELSGLLHYQEGPPPYNVVIRGNVIRQVNRGIKSTFMTLNHPPAVTTPMGMLLIAGNDIAESSERALVLANVEDSVVCDNQFGESAQAELRLCRDILFEGNASGTRMFTRAACVSESCTTGILWR